MCLRKVLFISALLLCFSAPGISSAADQYTMTAQELETLEDIFSQLSRRQAEQKRLLTEQAGQLTTLNEQLETSRTEIEKSKKATATLQTSLTAANESLQKSAAEMKTEKDRLERQRDTWAIVAGLFVVFCWMSY